MLEEHITQVATAIGISLTELPSPSRFDRKMNFFVVCIFAHRRAGQNIELRCSETAKPVN